MEGFCLFFRATPMAYGSSQARGQIGAAAASLHHSHIKEGPSLICNLHNSSQQRWILNPLSEARDQTWVFMAISQVCYCWATRETPNGPIVLKSCKKNRCNSSKPTKQYSWSLEQWVMFSVESFMRSQIDIWGSEGNRKARAHESISTMV